VAIYSHQSVSNNISKQVYPVLLVVVLLALLAVGFSVLVCLLSNPLHLSNPPLPSHKLHSLLLTTPY
jgi:hypothetical protein